VALAPGSIRIEAAMSVDRRYACDYELFGTRIVCNPRGYPSESSGDRFAADLVVQI
jgi:hypothetical protein